MSIYKFGNYIMYEEYIYVCLYVCLCISEYENCKCGDGVNFWGYVWQVLRSLCLVDNKFFASRSADWSYFLCHHTPHVTETIWFQIIMKSTAS